MTRKKRDFSGEDDGRTIVDMNVEGMPWYTPEGSLPRNWASRRERREQARKDPPLTKQEARYYTWGALKAALLVVGVMCAGLVLFVLFCQFVWFRN